LLHAIHRAVAAGEGAVTEAIRRRVRDLGYPVSAKAVERSLEHLRGMGIVTGDNRLLMQPLYPAYLIARLNRDDRSEVREQLSAHDQQLRQRPHRLPRKEVKQLELFLHPVGAVELIAGDLNTLIRFRAPQDVIEGLRRQCEARSGDSVRVYVVVGESHAA